MTPFFLQPTKFCWMLPGRSIFNRRKNFETLVTLELQGFQMKMAEGILNSSNLANVNSNSINSVLCMSSIHTGEVQTISILNSFTVAILKSYTAGTNAALEFSENKEVDLYTGFYGISVPLSITLNGTMSNAGSVAQGSITIVPKIILCDQMFAETQVLQNLRTGTDEKFNFYYTVSYEMTNLGTHINIKLNSGTHTHVNGYSGAPQTVLLSVSITAK